MKSPTYEVYSDLIQKISNDINYNWYYREIISKIISNTTFADYIIENVWENHVKDNVLRDVFNSIRDNINIKNYYNFYPSYIVIKIISQFLTDEMDDFSKIQNYLQMIETKKHNIINYIIKNYDFTNVKKLQIYDFEYEVESDSELLKVLQLSNCYPNILFIYAFKYNLRKFTKRINDKYDNKIVELFFKYKNNKYTETLKKEIYLVNNRKLKEIIIDQVLVYDDKFQKYIEKDETLRQILSSKISDEKIYEYENFNFYEFNDDDNKIKLKKLEVNNTNNTTSEQNFISFINNIQDLDKIDTHFPDNLERIKEVLSTIAIHKKFNIMLPKNLIDNYTSKLPVFLKNHVILFTLEQNDRKITDMQFQLYFTRGLPLVFKTDDITLEKFVGPLLSRLALTFRSDAFNIYREKVSTKTLCQEDLFMDIWMKKQLQYISHFISCISLYLDINNISPSVRNLTEILTVFSNNTQFTKLKTTYDDIPTFFYELLEFYFVGPNFLLVRFKNRI
jgi:hypothetical protein